MKHIALLLLLSGISFAQNLPNKPQPKTHPLRNVLIANAALYGSSLVGANATSHGSHACALESGKPAFTLPSGEHIGLVHPYRTYFKRSIPIDAGLTVASIWAHKKHHNLLAVLLPSTGAAFQLGVAGTEYSAGCF